MARPDAEYGTSQELALAVYPECGLQPYRPLCLKHLRYIWCLIICAVAESKSLAPLV